MFRVRIPLLFLLIALTCCASLLLTAGCETSSERGLPSLDAEFHAVVLTTGQVYYGRMGGSDNGFVVLTDVHYIIGQQAQEDEGPKGSLIRRGRELHGPNKTLVNRNHVLMIEPVTPDSRVGKLIQEARKRDS